MDFVLIHSSSEISIPDEITRTQTKNTQKLAFTHNEVSVVLQSELCNTAEVSDFPLKPLV